jgi:cobalamin synthase
MVFVPLVGFAFGAAAALVDHATASLGNGLVRSVVVILVLTAATKALHPIGLARTVAALRANSSDLSKHPNAPRIGAFGWLAATVLVALEVACLAAITNPAARAQAIVLATMLSRWAIVPIGYGLRPLNPSGLGLPYEGGITFREFAIGSVVALGIAMGLYEIVALAAIVALALTILSIRLLFIRRLGGASGYALAGGAAVCELVVLATLAALRI